MKIGICLIGVSYNDVHYGRRRDFRLSSDNYKEMLYNPYAENNEMSVYVTTYPHKFNNDLLNTYKPKKHLFIPAENSHQRITYLNGLSLLEGEDLDIIICTRFDIDFHKIIKDLDIDYTKFNFLFKEHNTWDPHRFVDDNLFIFPPKYLGAMKKAIETIHQGEFKHFNFLHNVYNPIVESIGEENTRFISSELHELSHSNTFYTLRRI